MVYRDCAGPLLQTHLVMDKYCCNDPGRDVLKESYHCGSLYCPSSSLESKCNW